MLAWGYLELLDLTGPRRVVPGKSLLTQVSGPLIGVHTKPGFDPLITQYTRRGSRLSSCDWIYDTPQLSVIGRIV